MTDYKIGAGIADMTGPVYDGVMMGFAEENQKSRGIHLRQYARAFVILHKPTGKRVAIVVIDTWSSTIALNRAVISRLQNERGIPKGLFTIDNVMITGQHTHAGPGGFSEYGLYNLTIGGFDKRTFEAHLNGVVEAIKRANRNLVDGDILVAKGILPNCGKNRSIEAFHQNKGVKKGDRNTTDRGMLLLKFVSSRGRELGTLNWYAIHTTSMAQFNEYISGDNKGYASYLMERDMGTDPYSAAPTYVAAFANANCGDVSGNLKPPEPADYLKNTYNYGRRQYDKAVHLANTAKKKLNGPVDYRHTFIPIADIRDRKTQARLTWPACYGISFARGSSVDGVPSLLVPGIEEGITIDSKKGLNVTLRDLVRQILSLASVEEKHPSVPANVRKGQGKKPIIFGPGLFDPPLAPPILPIQIFRIGPILVAGVPAEITTMAGRRLREALLEVFKGSPEPVTDVMVTPNANAYSGYITTREEYDVQYYEGASTLYGPNTALAYRQEFVHLAEAMRDNQPVSPGTAPPNLLPTADKKDLDHPTGSKTPSGLHNFGDILAFPKSEYERGETVSAKFVVANPFIDKKQAETFMSVLRNDGTAANPKWRRVYSDRDASTFIRFRRHFLDAFHLTVTWNIPDDAEPGRYKIRHTGYFKRSPKGSTGSFSSTTPVFEVKK